MRLPFRLIFGQPLGQIDLWSGVPPRMRLPFRLKFGDTISSQVDIWSYIRSG